MKVESFNFTYGDIKLQVTAAVHNGSVITNKYCPQELITGGIRYISAINGESAAQFISDCQKQIIAMSISEESDKLYRHIGGLMAVVMEHIDRCGRLIFGDLLIYIDCFSLLLEADGFSETEIRKMYPRITRSIVDQFADFVKATADLSPFVDTPIYFILRNYQGGKSDCLPIQRFWHIDT